jgi:serine/threonine-protein kinase
MNPASPNKRLRWRQRMVLSRMRRWGYLFEKEVLTEKKPALAAPVTETTATVDTALQQVPATDTATPEPPTETTGTAPTETAPPAATLPKTETEPPATTTTSPPTTTTSPP